MRLELYYEDLRPEYEGCPIADVTFDMFTEAAQKAIVAIGNGVFFLNDANFKRIFPPEVSQAPAEEVRLEFGPPSNSGEFVHSFGRGEEENKLNELLGDGGMRIAGVDMILEKNPNRTDPPEQQTPAEEQPECARGEIVRPLPHPGFGAQIPENTYAPIDGKLSHLDKPPAEPQHKLCDAGFDDGTH